MTPTRSASIGAKRRSSTNPTRSWNWRSRQARTTFRACSGSTSASKSMRTARFAASPRLGAAWIPGDRSAEVLPGRRRIDELYRRYRVLHRQQSASDLRWRNDGPLGERTISSASRAIDVRSPSGDADCHGVERSSRASRAEAFRQKATAATERRSMGSKHDMRETHWRRRDD